MKHVKPATGAGSYLYQPICTVGSLSASGFKIKQIGGYERN
jgi:hypothetical protein